VISCWRQSPGWHQLAANRGGRTLHALTAPHAASHQGISIYPRTKNLRAVQLPLGHTRLESTVRYLGIEVDDALEMAEQAEV
jgi:hypothetical protein